MNSLLIHDPLFREALAAVDAGDEGGLDRLLAAHPRLVRDRVEGGEGYFRRPYLLWFVAENPIRTGSLPANVAEVTRTILRAAEREGVDLREQIDYALVLVGSGKVARECGVQIALLDVLVEAGADRDGALLPALAHREVAAAERLLERGARLTLPAAVALGRTGDLERLGSEASPEERQTALATAAFYGQAPALALLIDLGVDLQAYSPAGFHPHATALHHSVDSGVLAAVQVLVKAGADLQVKDRIHQATPLGWAEYLGRDEIAGYLRGRSGEKTLPTPAG
jgi:peptide-methionine (S)-S-oxide reductase